MTDSAMSSSRVGSHVTTPSPLGCWFWVVFTVMAVAKLALVAQQEILLYSADDQGFAYSAAGWYWGTPYGIYSHVRQPVYPLFVATSAALGMPLRVSIEIVWLAACGWSVAALRRCGGHPIVLLVSATAILFHPWLLNLNSRMLADTLYAPLLLVFLTGTAAALLADSWRAMWRWAAPAALAGALAANTRQESILIYGSIAVAALIALALRLCRAANGAITVRRLAIVAGVPLLATLALTHAFRAANAYAVGVYSSYDLESPGYRSLYKALLAIPPETHDLRLPVTRDVREKAYQVSPTFATLRHALEEDPRLSDYARACEWQTGVKGEYGAWTCWAIRLAAWVSREFKITSARELDGLFATAAGEIRAAMRDGRIGHRFVAVDFLPPEWGELARQAPHSAVAAWRVWVSPSPGAGRSQSIPPQQAANFEASALRRTSLAQIVDPPSPGTQQRGLTHAPGWRARTISAVQNTAPTLGLVTGIVTGLGFVFAAFALLRRWLSVRWMVLMGVLGAALFARTALVIVLDATGIDAQRRYLLPASVIAIIFSLFTLQGLVAALLRRLRPRPAVTERDPAET